MTIFKDLNYNLQLDISIQIENTIIYNVENIEFSSYRNKASELRLTLNYYTQPIDIQVGQKVIYKRGYVNGVKETRFVGYIYELGNNEIVCYDNLFFINSMREVKQEWIGTQETLPNGNIKIKKDISDKTILQNILSNVTYPIDLNFNLTESFYSKINGNVNKGVIIRALFNHAFFYIHPLTSNFIVEEAYSRINTEYNITNKIMIEDNTNQPVDQLTKIRYILQSGTNQEEDIIGEYPENVETDKVLELYFSDISLTETINRAISKYNQLNNIKLIGNFTLTGLPFISSGEKIKVKDELVNVAGIDETVSSIAIRQRVILE